MTCSRCGKEIKDGEERGFIDITDLRSKYGERFDLCQDCNDKFWHVVDVFIQAEVELI